MKKRRRKEQPPETPETAAFFTTEEAASYLGITPRRVRQLCRQGRLGRQIGRNYAITEHQLITFSEIERTAGRPPKKNRD